MTYSSFYFPSRIDNYIKYRPSYPRAIVDFLKAKCQLTPASIIADLGSGTGKLSELFLENGNHIIGIEPNEDMRKAAEHLLVNYARFASVDARAESTMLDNNSVDFVTAGQSFHWFDREAVRQECSRILKPQGWVVLLWNNIMAPPAQHLAAYERFLFKYKINIGGRNWDPLNEAAIRSFFEPGQFRLKSFNNKPVFDFESLKGLLLSLACMPGLEHPTSSAMLSELYRIFQAHQVNGRASFKHTTLMYYGHLTSAK